MEEKIRISELLKKDINALLLCFFNINIDNDDFYLAGSFKKSSYATISFEKKRLFEDVCVGLREYYQLPFITDKNEYRCYIDNDLGYTFDNFINNLTTNIMVLLSKNDYGFNLDKEIGLAIFILRGSIDFARNYMSIDLKRNIENENYLNNMMKILVSSNEVIKYLNFNFRNLQGQYVSGENKRNNQLRMNLRWISNNLINEYKLLNIYKYNILESNQDKVGNLPKSDEMYIMFLKRMQYYSKNIMGKELSDKELNSFRNDLFNEETDKVVRNKQIQLLIKSTTEDICVACNTIYNISNRSFIVPKDNRFYFEYHHVISFSRDKENLDIPDNLVKLCPTCHRAMTPNRADNDYQKMLIKNILECRKDTLEFCKLYFDTINLEQTINKIHEHLA